MIIPRLREIPPRATRRAAIKRQANRERQVALICGVDVPLDKVQSTVAKLRVAGIKAIVKYTKDELEILYRSGKFSTTLIASGGKAQVPTEPRHADSKDFLKGIRAVHAGDKALYPHWR